MSLTAYTKKRNFNNTPEPEGKSKSSQKKLSFVIQRHDASHLHYDFRLELDGVLKSWAIPKGPSLNPQEKRFAVMVEDHPLSYGKFQGVIPKGNYGAGTVEIWDAGTYVPETSNSKAPASEIRRGLKTGSLKFIINGQKLKGSFALVRLKDGKEKNWLLIKHRDEYATDDYDIESERTIKAVPAKKAKSVRFEVDHPDKKMKTKKITAKKSTSGSNDKIIKINGHEVKLTNQQKIYWPEEGFTKGDVIEYYNSVADYILPYLKDRPQSLKRNPNGIADKGFYHKDAGDKAPGWVKSVKIYSESTQKNVDYIICNDKATLLYLNNLGCIEINPWNSRIKTPDHPDYLILDIDPSDNNTFNQVIDVALVIKEVLDKAGATCYCKTSGATGIHVYMPLHAAYTYEQARPFAQLVAVLANEQLPSFTTLERALNKRKNRIYIDFLQNSRGQTLSSVYSIRPVPGASISTPLLWKEVKHGLDPLDFNILNMNKRLGKTGDIFGGVLKDKNNLKTCIKALES